MDTNEEDSNGSPPVWVFIVIPIVSALVGYLTNVLAIKMSFYPLEFTGIKIWQPANQPFGLIGWQGIVPSRARIMATKITTLFLDGLLDIEEIFGRVNPEIVREKCKPGTKILSERIARRTMDLLVPNVYDYLHSETKIEIQQVVEDQSSAMVARLMSETQSRILEMLDMVELMGRLAEENKHLAVQMFVEVGQKEFRLLELSGLVFGFIFGCIQALIYLFYEGWFVLPLAGLFVGWFTNFMAIKLIFEPTDPINILGIKIQGAFLKRQQEAAESIAATSQTYFLTVDNLMNEIAFGSGQPIFTEMISRITREYMDGVLGGVGGLIISLAASPDFRQNLEAEIISISLRDMTHIWPLAYDHIDEALDLKETLRVKLQVLPPRQFVGTLRPVFQEDELKLIIVGAILGMVVGFIQQYLVFNWI